MSVSTSELVKETETLRLLVRGYLLDMKIRQVPVHERNRGVILGETEDADTFVSLTIFSDEPVANKVVSETKRVMKQYARHTLSESNIPIS